MSTKHKATDRTITLGDLIIILQAAREAERDTGADIADSLMDILLEEAAEA
ncbi:hypothetical protein [Pelagibacterium luteolum]|uniref:Uncharacterized protein n=1 Tax=Pelagibacterium luteolum TaxID=440168 RepID=A0A1G7ZGX1_9HYPH|nr:hypothetical protein [Pelagibacterium luteolum]SDH07855.1 hypothetical protein SAMN04487974_1205 [Pelagibacterium luteolum]